MRYVFLPTAIGSTGRITKEVMTRAPTRVNAHELCMTMLAAYEAVGLTHANFPGCAECEVVLELWVYPNTPARPSARGGRMMCAQSNL